MAREPAHPPGIDPDVPNVARMYDYWLGGTHHFAADRKAADTLLEINPGTDLMARANRAFVRRAVRFLTAEAGIRQFIDIGAGLPTQGNVHEIAQQILPAARVVYVDYDPVVVAHSRALLMGNPAAAAIVGDARQKTILADHELRKLIDFASPVAILLAGILHYIPEDDDPDSILAYLRNAMAPGSYLVISHGCDEGMSPDHVRRAYEIFNRSTAPIVSRTRARVTRWFDGLDILPPGVVWVPQWRPGPGEEVPDPQGSHFLGAAGKKPTTPGTPAPAPPKSSPPQ